MTEKLPTRTLALTDEQAKAYNCAAMLLFAALPVLSGTEHKLLTMVVFCTFGDGLEECAISFTEFSQGIDNDRTWQGGTGLSRASVVRGINSLHERGLIVRRRGRYEDGFIYRANLAAIAALSRRVN